MFPTEQIPEYNQHGAVKYKDIIPNAFMDFIGYI